MRVSYSTAQAAPAARKWYWDRGTHLFSAGTWLSQRTGLLRCQRLGWLATDSEEVAADYRAGKIDKLLPTSTGQFREMFRKRSSANWARSAAPNHLAPVRSHMMISSPQRSAARKAGITMSALPRGGT
jgi:hypothetical protein